MQLSTCGRCLFINMKDRICTNPNSKHHYMTKVEITFSCFEWYPNDRFDKRLL